MDGAPRDGVVDAEEGGDHDGGNGQERLPRFTDVTEQAGLMYKHWDYDPDDDDCSEGLSECGIRWFAAGAAVGDFDGDGLPDLYVTRIDDRDILFRNVGDGTFEDVTVEAGLDAVFPSNGAAWADVNDDGHLDLMVTTLLHPRSYLYVNQGDGTFIEEAAERSLAQEDGATHFMFAPAFGDYDMDGWLDVQTTEWHHFTPSTETHAQLFRNRGADAPGHFEDASDVGASLANGSLAIYAFAAAFTDLDGDMWPDLVVVGDFSTTRLFWNQRDGTFLEGTDDLGEGVPSDENGMGLAVGDIDGDGRMDWFVTSILDDRFPCRGCPGGPLGNRLYLNAGDRKFTDATAQYGVEDGGWGWGAQAFDYDNDGKLDLVMANGMYPYEPELERFAEDPMRLWRNTGEGEMVELAVESGLDTLERGKAVVVFDYDGDGDLDLFVAHNASHGRLYRNDGPVGSYLRVRAEGLGARAGGTNRHGVGVRVEVHVTEDAEPMVRELNGGHGYLSQSENVAHFGIGEHEHVHQVRVLWPVTGAEEVLHDVPANQTLTVKEGDAS